MPKAADFLVGNTTKIIKDISLKTLCGLNAFKFLFSFPYVLLTQLYLIMKVINIPWTYPCNNLTTMIFFGHFSQTQTCFFPNNTIQIEHDEHTWAKQKHVIKALDAWFTLRHQ